MICIWPSGAHVSTSGPRVANTGPSEGPRHTVELAGSEALRLALRLAEGQTNAHVPLHPAHRRVLEAAVAMLRRATEPRWLEHMDRGSFDLVEAWDEPDAVQDAVWERYTMGSVPFH